MTKVEYRVLSTRISGLFMLSFGGEDTQRPSTRDRVEANDIISGDEIMQQLYYQF